MTVDDRLVVENVIGSHVRFKHIEQAHVVAAAFAAETAFARIEARSGRS